MWLFHPLTIRNDHHGESAEHFQGSHDPSVPFRGDLYVEECGEGEHFGVLNIFLSLEGGETVIVQLLLIEIKRK